MQFLPGLFQVVESIGPAGEKRQSFSFGMLTRTANELMANIHNDGEFRHRMPLFLTPELEEYGHEIDDWSALFLTETHEHFQSLESRVGKSIEAIDRAASKLNSSKQPLQFQDRYQALFYGLGVSGPYAISAVFISALFYLLISQGQQYVDMQRMVYQYPNAPAYRQIMQQGKIFERDGMLYLQLVSVPKKGEVQIGRHYLYDSQAKRVLVPLGSQ